MIANAEFRRNLWIQFSSTRVLVAALITGLLLACALAVDFALTTRRAFNPDITAFVARWLAIAILLFWAGRQAAGAVLGAVLLETLRVIRPTARTAIPRHDVVFPFPSPVRTRTSPLRRFSGIRFRSLRNGIGPPSGSAMGL